MTTMSHRSSGVSSGQSHGIISPELSSRLLVSCERWKSCIMKWEELTTQGLKIANKLVNKLLSKKTVSKETIGALARMKDVLEVYEEHVVQQSQSLFPKVRENLDSLSNVHSQMQGIHRNLQTMQGKLLEFQESAIVLGVTISDLVSTSGRLLASYERELQVREAIIRGMSTEEPQRRTYMLYLTTWATEPYVSDHSKDRFYLRNVVELLKRA
eukprot:m.604198 g.604198  ORF g.604198 m.604198 type:complete len:213 (+) comp22457_c0_seq26:543-1181(+)